MSWQKVKLGELGEFRNGLNYSKANEGSGLKVISVKDFGDLRVPNFAELDEINPSGLNIRNSLLAAGDIIFVRSNGNKDLIGRSMFIEKAQENVSFSGFCIRFRNQSDFAHSKFLAYYFRSPIFRRTLSNLGGGTNINNLNQGVLGNFPILLPSLDQQETILRTLSAYDDLIENNRRRIGLLEQAARLLYREWFVHLRFPGHETAKIVDGLPEGWERATLSDHVELVKDAVQPGAFRPDDVHIGLEHIPRRSFVLSDWEPTEGLESHKFRFAAGDIIFGKIRPYFHKVGFALRDGVASSDAFVWRVKDQKAWSLLICATSSDHFVAVASKTVKEGSKMPRADWKVLAKYKIPKPNDDLLAEFDGRVRPIAEECRKLALQNRALTRARDLLLPRLMDGRIPV